VECAVAVGGTRMGAGDVSVICGGPGGDVSSGGAVVEVCCGLGDSRAGNDALPVKKGTIVPILAKTPSKIPMAAKIRVFDQARLSATVFPSFEAIADHNRSVETVYPRV